MTFGDNRFRTGDLIKNEHYYGIVLRLEATHMLVAQSNGVIVKEPYGNEWKVPTDVAVHPHFIELANLWACLETAARDKLMEIFEEVAELTGLTPSIRAVKQLDNSINEVLDKLGAPAREGKPWDRS